MAKAKKKVSKIKVKKKLWYKVIAPKIFAQKEIGESYLFDPEKAVGRKLKVNLKDLTGNVKAQNVYIGFQITNVNGNTLNTSITSYELTPSYVKRVVRKNTNKIDDYCILTTKGGKKIIVKSLMVSRGKTQKSKHTGLRKRLQELLNEEFKKNSFESLVSLLVNRRLIFALKKNLDKIFPLKEVTIRAMKLQEKGLIQEEVTIDDKTVEEKKETKTEVADKEEVSKEEAKEVVEETKKEAPTEEKAETVPESEESKENSTENKEELKEE